MAIYTHEAFYLGTFSDLDPTEGNSNTISENANLLVGQIFGSEESMLRNDVVSLAMNDSNNDGTFKEDRNAEQMTYNLGAGSVTRALDSSQQYTATITYASYTGLSPVTVPIVIVQDAAGNLFWVPPSTTGATGTAMGAGAIQSVTIDGLVTNNSTGLSMPRPTVNLLCFGAGTLIATDKGEVPVEALKAGDLVMTLDHGAQPVRWVASRRVVAEGDFAPVEFAAGAIGNRRALRVSPQHRMLVTGWRSELFFGEAEVLVPAAALVNDRDVRRVTGGSVTYFHLMFDRHEIVLSEGVPSESLYVSAASLSGIEPAARAELLALFPELDRAEPEAALSARPILRMRPASVLSSPMALAG